ncbi:sugar-specific transcriptional regulator TrmB [bacterium BMS3Abin07]|nr:sugar-specific transcriptional regulator TrmB [bacterium BMS3Abin07]GBE32444.1 sugar-specific transcriptional regulator TrmB [bacterium BMS3Bbin05]HDL20130.1 TrmB family transcriptional regulator [Nitrospirota bacterium]HDO23149.1 TrmB family transcriptional regulator [Nitrospirota bacterium]HDZ87766.1 TrmB family transcriptional regulator [Nitrospirota bacterium]
MVVNIIDKLMDIGLSEYEARAYAALLGKSPATAYGLARASGIPTSKIYEILSRLSEKGIAFPVDENGTKRYIPMEPDEFIESHRSRVETTLAALKENLASVGNVADLSYIWNIKDYGYLIDKAGRMILEAKKTLLISVWEDEMGRLEKILEKAKSRKVRIAVIHFGTPEVIIGQVFQHPIEDTIYAEKGGRGLVVVADSKAVLMGTIFKDGRVEGAWSLNRGFVTMAEDYIKHDIYMMKIVRRFDRTLKDRFGDRYEELRDIFRDREAI